MKKYGKCMLIQAAGLFFLGVFCSAASMRGEKEILVPLSSVFV